MIVGITGIIAGGKSTFGDFLGGHLQAEKFDSDSEVRKLLDRDETVWELIRDAFGDSVFDPDAKPDRRILRDRIFSSEEDRFRLEAILHPRVRSKWESRIREYRFTSRRSEVLLVDIPLLFESKVEDQFDIIISVHCSMEIQLQRMDENRGIPRNLAQNIIRSQMTGDEKMRRAGCVVWNDGALDALEQQAKILANFIDKRNVSRN